MKKYYLTDGSQTLGPFSLEELKEKEISRDSYVWHEELADWQTAGSLEELGEIFDETGAAPPPIQPPPVVYQLPPTYPVAESALPPVAKHSKVWPKVMIGISVPIVAMVVLLLTGVIEIPGVFERGKEKDSATQINRVEKDADETFAPLTGQDAFDGIAQGAPENEQELGRHAATPYLGDPYSDAIAFVRAQEEFARIANEAAEDGILDGREIRQLENAYQDVLLFLVKYETDTTAQEEIEELLDGVLSDRSTNASTEFALSIFELGQCEGFEEFSQKMEDMANQLNINFD